MLIKLWKGPILHGEGSGKGPILHGEGSGKGPILHGEGSGKVFQNLYLGSEHHQKLISSSDW